MHDMVDEGQLKPVLVLDFSGRLGESGHDGAGGVRTKFKVLKLFSLSVIKMIMPVPI